MILPIQYHRQDDRLKCGSACAQMVLESLSPGSALIRQQILYDGNISQTNLTLLDFAAIARAYGHGARTIEKEEEISAVFGKGRELALVD